MSILEIILYVTIGASVLGYCTYQITRMILIKKGKIKPKNKKNKIEKDNETIEENDEY